MWYSKHSYGKLEINLMTPHFLNRDKGKLVLFFWGFKDIFHTYSKFIIDFRKSK